MKLDILKIMREAFIRRLLSLMGPQPWNEIPREIKQCIDHETFKTGIGFLETFGYFQVHLKKFHQR